MDENMNPNGAMGVLHSKVDALSGKVDLINQQLIEVRVRVELQAERLQDVKSHGEDIARLDTYIKVMWAIMLITILGVGADLVRGLIAH